MVSNGIVPPPKKSRTEKVKRLEDAFRKYGDSKTREQIIAEFCYLEGVSKRTVNEYIEMLELANKI